MLWGGRITRLKQLRGFDLLPYDKANGLLIALLSQQRLKELNWVLREEGG